MVGCGSRLRNILWELQKVTGDTEIVALYDPSESAIEGTKYAFNIDPTIYTEVDDLVRDSDVDWVLVGSWNCYHAEQVIRAFDAGKHVFCEKPLATTLEDCLAMREAWRRSGKLFTIGFTLRYSPHYIRIKEILDAGTIGDIISMEFNETLGFNHGGFIHSDWRRKSEWAGSHLLEKCCHDMDLAHWLTGSLPRRVASFGGCDFFIPANAHHVRRVGRDAEGREAFKTMNDPDIAGATGDPFTVDKDIVDNQVAILEFDNGVRATFHTNCSTAIPERRMYICGSEGTLRADVLAGSIEVKRIGFDTECEDLSTGASGGHGGGDSFLGRSLADMMVHGAPSPASLEDGLRAAITVFAIDEAERTGRVVDLAPWWRRAGT